MFRMSAGILSFGIHQHRAVKPRTALHGDKHYWFSETEKPIVPLCAVSTGSHLNKRSGKT
jgi:hypothetical protein